MAMDGTFQRFGATNACFGSDIEKRQRSRPPKKFCKLSQAEHLAIPAFILLTTALHFAFASIAPFFFERICSALDTLSISVERKDATNTLNWCLQYSHNTAWGYLRSHYGVAESVVRKSPNWNIISSFVFVSKSKILYVQNRVSKRQAFQVWGRSLPSLPKRRLGQYDWCLWNVSPALVCIIYYIIFLWWIKFMVNFIQVLIIVAHTIWDVIKELCWWEIARWHSGLKIALNMQLFAFNYGSIKNPCHWPLHLSVWLEQPCLFKHQCSSASAPGAK